MPNKQGLKSLVNAADDEGAHVAALALAEASQRGGSPQVSRTPGRKSDHMRHSPGWSSERKVVADNSLLVCLSFLTHADLKRLMCLFLDTNSRILRQR